MTEIKWRQVDHSAALPGMHVATVIAFEHGQSVKYQAELPYGYQPKANELRESFTTQHPYSKIDSIRRVQTGLAHSDFELIRAILQRAGIGFSDHINPEGTKTIVPETRSYGGRDNIEFEFGLAGQLQQIATYE